ncbi:hypothetical protein BDK51DRAFT_26721, partial [Blyttiomyces helicus]
PTAIRPREALAPVAGGDQASDMVDNMDRAAYAPREDRLEMPEAITVELMEHQKLDPNKKTTLVVVPVFLIIQVNPPQYYFSERLQALLLTIIPPSPTPHPPNRWKVKGYGGVGCRPKPPTDQEKQKQLNANFNVYNDDRDSDGEDDPWEHRAQAGLLTLTGSIPAIAAIMIHQCSLLLPPPNRFAQAGRNASPGTGGYAKNKHRYSGLSCELWLPCADERWGGPEISWVALPHATLSGEAHALRIENIRLTVKKVSFIVERADDLAGGDRTEVYVNSIWVGVTL